MFLVQKAHWESRPPNQGWELGSLAWSPHLLQEPTVAYLPPSSLSALPQYIYARDSKGVKGRAPKPIITPFLKAKILAEWKTGSPWTPEGVSIRCSIAKKNRCRESQGYTDKLHWVSKSSLASWFPPHKSWSWTSAAIWVFTWYSELTQVFFYFFKAIKQLLFPWETVSCGGNLMHCFCRLEPVQSYSDGLSNWFGYSSDSFDGSDSNTELFV